jgi:hypothetical protein
MRTLPMMITRECWRGNGAEDETMARFACDDGPGGKIPGQKPIREDEVRFPLD